MNFNVRVYCNGCHRENMLTLTKAFSEKEVRKKGICPSCTAKGKLVYVSSIGRR